MKMTVDQLQGYIGEPCWLWDSISMRKKNPYGEKSFGTLKRIEIQRKQVVFIAEYDNEEYLSCMPITEKNKFKSVIENNSLLSNLARG